MDEQQYAIATMMTLAGAMLLACAAKNRKPRKKRQYWVRNWLQRREERGSHKFLMEELRLEDKYAFRNYLRMNEETYLFLLSLLESKVRRKNTIMRKAISAEEKLASTLRFLATGESYQSMEYSTRLSKAFLCLCVPEVCLAIYEALKNEYMKFPETHEEWKKIADGFHTRWQFPLCLGAMDGKHVQFRAKRNVAPLYRNYKGSQSIVLFGLVDAHYRFIYIDVGRNGRMSDGGIFRHSSLARKMEQGEQIFPPAEVIGDNRRLPYVIVADAAFPLQEHIMKPYSHRCIEHEKKVFNYRLSRARRTVEHAFGILANRFRILLNPINLKATTVSLIVNSACVLHNLLSKKSQNYSGNEDEVFSENLPDYVCVVNRAREAAVATRVGFTEYFVNEGKVPWQDAKV